MLRLALTISLLAASASVALAQHGGTPDEQRACTRDAQRYCRKSLGDDMAVQQCLQEHRRHLTSACNRVFESHGM